MSQPATIPQQSHPVATTDRHISGAARQLALVLISTHSVAFVQSKRSKGACFPAW